MTVRGHMLSDGTVHFTAQSGDAKPTTNVPAGSYLLEEDTGYYWVFEGSAWKNESYLAHPVDFPLDAHDAIYYPLTEAAAPFANLGYGGAAADMDHVVASPTFQDARGPFGGVPGGIGFTYNTTNVVYGGESYTGGHTDGFGNYTASMWFWPREQAPYGYLFGRKGFNDATWTPKNGGADNGSTYSFAFYMDDTFNYGAPCFGTGVKYTGSGYSMVVHEAANTYTNRWQWNWHVITMSWTGLRATMVSYLNGMPVQANTIGLDAWPNVSVISSIIPGPFFVGGRGGAGAENATYAGAGIICGCRVRDQAESATWVRDVWNSIHMRGYQ